MEISCPPNKGLTESDIHFDFTKASGLDQWKASGDFAAADLPLVEATGLGEVKVNVGLGQTLVRAHTQCRLS
jgi:hypothetical protein